MIDNNKMFLFRKTLLLFLFVNTIIILISAHFHSAITYELSIYQSTPQLIWYLLILNISIGLWIISSEIIDDNYRQNLWVLTVLLLLLNRIIIQWLPFLRGYYTLQGDHMSQIGFCNDILMTGHIPLDNFYPVTHIILSEINMLTGVSILNLGNFGTALISAFNLITIYILSRELLSNKKAQMICLVSAVVVFFSGYELYLMPNGWSIFFIPITVYVFFKARDKKDVRWAILLVVCMMLFPFFHPLSALFLIIMFFIVGILSFLIGYIQKENITSSFISKNMPTTEISILFISFFTWIMSFKIFTSNIQYFHKAITGGDVPNFLNNMELSISKLGIDTMEFVSFLFRSMGHIFIFLILSAFAFLALVRSKDFLKANKNLFIIFIIAGVAGLLYVSTIFNLLPGTSAIGGERLIAYTIIFVPIFIGYGSIKIILKENRMRFNFIVFILLILCASTISIFSLFPSPRVLSPGLQVTYMDVQTANWIISRKSDAPLSSIISTPNRFAENIYGMYTGKVLIPYNIFTPDHFGYKEYNKVGDSLETERYIMINQIDRITYNTVWEEVGRFNKNDFENLYNDASIHKLYSNGEGEIWFALKL